MAKVVLYIAMSLDGYIADHVGNVDWLGGDGSSPEEAGSYPEFYQSIGTIVLGYTTYHQIVTELFVDKWVYDDKISYVITHKEKESTDNIIFTNTNPVDLINELKTKDTGDIWICGGAKIVNPLIENDVIDIYCISIIPTILGDGVRLFSKHEKEHPLMFVSSREYNGIVDVVYKRRK